LNESLRYLPLAAVKAIHCQVLAAHGGARKIREDPLLESAVAAPEASMMGQPLISDPIEIAAAYLFYICRNHPFVDAQQTNRARIFSCLFRRKPASARCKTTGRRLGSVCA
jgi:death on curing protein